MCSKTFYRGKPAVRNFRGGNGNVGIIRSPVRAIALPDNFQASSMVDAAATLGWFFDRPVLERTRLTGEYDFAIEYEVDPDERGPVFTPNTSGLGGNCFNPFTGLTGAALSVGLQSVGLRLESTKAPVEVLVIDRLERPTEN